MDVSTAVKKRISTRAFLDKELARDDVEQWLKDAQRAPSGGNLQPWRVIALAGEEKLEVENLAAEKLLSNPRGEPTDYPIYPEFITDAQNERRRAVGEAMYGKLGIPREDRAGRMVWFARNYRFFDAPLALFIVMDERVGHGQWGHAGMFMQTLCLLAEERGRNMPQHSCIQVPQPR
ncbi:MAG: nitroreductase family protein, partial [Pseudomonadota bacterium]